MALVKRLVKGSPLTAQEMDDNLDYLAGLIPVGSTSGTSGTGGTSGTNGTTGTGGTSGLDGVNGLNGSNGTSGTTGTAGTSGLDGTNFGTAGTSGVDGTNGTAGSGGSSGTSGTSATAGAGSITVRDVDSGTSVTTVTQVNFTGDAVTVTAGSSGTALVTISGGTSGGALTIVSGSTTYASVSTVRLAPSIYISGTSGGGTDLTISALGSGGGGTNGTAGSGGSSGTSGVNGIAGTNGSSGTSAIGSSGTDGTPGTSGTSGTNGAGGTNGTGGTSGTSGLSTNLAFYDGGITEVTDVRYIQFSNEFTIAQITQYTASVSMSVVGGGGSANWDTLVNKPADIVSSSAQVKAFLPTGMPSGSLSDGYFWVGENGVFVARPTSSIVGAGGGTGIFELSDDTTYYTTTNYLEIIGGLTITSSIGVGSQSTNALTVTGSVDVLGSVSASALHVQSVGQPYLTSPSSINLQAESGSVNIVNSVLRLASYSDAQTASLIAQNGDMVYNTTSNKFFGYANGAWVALS